MDPSGPSTSKKPEHEIKKIKRWETAGKEIREKFCLFDGSDGAKHPVMLPPAPRCKYIDKFPESEELTAQHKGDMEHQENYAAEVAVYKALEKLDENLIVLHSLDYRHEQCRLLLTRPECKHKNIKKGTPCGKIAKDREGECDFLVIGNNYYVIIEVKNIENNAQAGALSKILSKSYQQRKKVRTIIQNIIEYCDADKNTNILDFSACPATLQITFQGINVMDKGIISKEDIDSFSIWWEKNVTNKVSSVPHRTPSSEDVRARNEKVKEFLLSIWCMDQNSRCDKGKCSLTQTIKEIDRGLKVADITFRRKNHENPAVIEAPEIFKKFLQINNLTSQQSLIFDSDQKFLWINGPAGSGKTILILGKIIQLVKLQPDHKVVLFKYGQKENITRRYQESLTKAGITVQSVQLFPNITRSRIPIPEQAEYISQTNSEVVIVEMQDNYLYRQRARILLIALGESHPHCNVFVDDLQVMIDSYTHGATGNVTSGALRTILRALKHTSSQDTTRTVWLACDIAQFLTGNTLSCGDYKELIEKMTAILESNLSGEERMSLSTNLRNTYEITSLLSGLRDEFLVTASISEVMQNMMFPKQEEGHYIYGPTPVVHILPHQYMVGETLNNELDKLSDSDGSLQNTDIAIVHAGMSSLKESIERIVKERTDENGQITVCQLEDCPSTEWPAVIVVYQMYISPRTEYLTCFRTDGLSRLYLAISRARVYCSVIILLDWVDLHTRPRPPNWYLDVEVKQYMDDFFNKLRAHALIRERCSFYNQRDIKVLRTISESWNWKSQEEESSYSESSDSESSDSESDYDTVTYLPSLTYR